MYGEALLQNKVFDIQPNNATAAFQVRTKLSITNK